MAMTSKLLSILSTSIAATKKRLKQQCGTFSRAWTLNTGPSWALTVFIRNMSLQMQMSPVHVPENTISSDQPYTAHIIVSVFPMFPLRPIRPPPERATDSHLMVRCVTAKPELCLLESLLFNQKQQPRGLTSLMPKLHMFHTSCDELVRKVGIYFDNKYLVLASPEKRNKTKHLCRKICMKKMFFFIFWCIHTLKMFLYFIYCPRFGLERGDI